MVIFTSIFPGYSFSIRDTAGSLHAKGQVLKFNIKLQNVRENEIHMMLNITRKDAINLNVRA